MDFFYDEGTFARWVGMLRDYDIEIFLGYDDEDFSKL
jgi:hypothetical protein